ncbi:MAG: hypothetical protein KDK63_05605, partial [Chlamydiia bacterium]|nr:hypothetical protein [Chlamydiia bacterium]
YIVPKAVLQDNATSFNERISHILGSNVIQDREFSRYQIDPLNKVASFVSAKEDLQKRLDFYESARANGTVLIQFPEIRQSMEAQEEAFGFLAVNQTLNPNETKLCLECKQLLGKIRSMKTYTIFDELDATQDFKACEVNFTEGQRIPIDQESIIPLNRCITLITQNRHLQAEQLAQLLLNGIGLDEGEKKTATFFVTSQDQKIEEINGLKELLETLQKNNPQAYATIFLVRALLFDDNMLEFVRSKEPSTHFGVRFSLQGGKRVYSYDPHTQSALLIAVPYEGTNTPKGLSNFDNTEVAAIATLRYYNSPETPLEKEPHLDFLIKQTQKNTLPQFLEGVVKDVKDKEKRTFVERLKHLSELLDPAEVQQAKQLFYEDFLKNPSPAVRTYFGMAVVATQVHSDEARANSNRYEMGTPDDKISGCSGTVGSTSSYFEKPANDPAADGKLSLEIMGRKENEEVKTLPEYRNGDYLTFILSSLLKCAKDNTRAIIDAAGLCKSRDGLPETIVEKLWDLLKQEPRFKDIEGIVYYGKDNVKRLYRGPGLPAIKCTTAMELEACKGKKYFSFYGQKNTRGSDIKQAEGAHALVTMDENVPNSDAKQAVLRFRGLVQRAFNQTFTFVLTHRFHALLDPNKQNGRVTAKDVALDLRKKEKEQEQRDALLLFRKELQAHVKQGAAHMEHVLFSTVDLSKPEVQKTYAEFLAERNNIVSLVETSLTKLEEKYGGSLQEMERDAFIAEETKRCQEKLKALEALANQTAKTLKNENPLLRKEFFENRITKSTELFQSRYPEKLPVRIAPVDTGAEAVALALAEAQAEALAEVVAEVLTHTPTHSTSRLPNLGIAMTDKAPFVPEQKWFANPNGQPIDNVEAMKHLIHPTMRQKILISPHLQTQQIVSHYALFPNDGVTNVSPIFVSYEEAEQWMKQSKNQINKNYQLIDLRKKLDHKASPLLRNMQVAVLREVEKLPEPGSTNELKQINLVHAESHQFLPHLTVTGAEKDKVAEQVDLTSFGVSKSGQATLTLENTEKEFTVTGQGVTITIPKQNEWLQPIFPMLNRTGKFTTLKTTFEQKSAAVRKQITDLRNEEATLNAKKQELAKVISNTSSFAITTDLKKGLEERDNEVL